jgi:hypothetical protein
MSTSWWLLAAAIIALVTVGSGEVAWQVWIGPWGLTDRLTAVGASFAFAALVDAAVASWVAVAAYYQATRKPDLRLLVLIGSGPTTAVARKGQSAPIFDVYKPDPATKPVLALQFFLDNRSGYTARNPALRMHVDDQTLWGPEFGGINVPPGWTVQAPLAMRSHTLQWEGGADQAVHGTWIRPVPLIQIPILAMPRDEPYSFVCEVVAEGFRRDFWLLIRVRS